MKMKTCSKCGEEFPATPEYFYTTIVPRAKNRILRGDCKTCYKKQAREYQRKYQAYLRKKRAARKAKD